MDEKKPIRRFNMILSQSNPLQREAWERIHAIPAGERTTAVCLAICRAFSRDDFLVELRKAVREIIQTELADVVCVPSDASSDAMQPETVDNMDDNVRDFLNSLHCG